MAGREGRKKSASAYASFILLLIEGKRHYSWHYFSPQLWSTVRRLWRAAWKVRQFRLLEINRD
jgi:hypothetical protein